MNKLELEELAKAIAAPLTAEELAEVIRAQDDCPWKEAGLSPAAWLAINWQRFYIPPSEIKPLRRYDPHQDLGDGWGVYFLFDINDALLYVGQSLYFENRLSDHFYKSPLPFVGYSLLPVPGLYITAVESYYINRERPVYNSKIPPLHYSFCAGKLLPC